MKLAEPWLAIKCISLKLILNNISLNEDEKPFWGHRCGSQKRSGQSLRQRRPQPLSPQKGFSSSVGILNWIPTGYIRYSSSIWVYIFAILPSC